MTRTAPPASSPVSERKRVVYVVEDDPEIGRLICRALNEFEFQAESFRTGGDVLRRLKRAEAVLCVIDLGLPDMDGMQVVREIQAGHDCAILILTGRSDVTDRVLGLELGADDYMVKPFEPRELVARARSILRRWSRAPGDDERQRVRQVRFADWTFDVGANRLYGAGKGEVALSAAEAALLLTLLRSPNRILSREQLLGERERHPFDRSIDVRISRLRNKIEDTPQSPQLIKTVYGAGYMLSANVAWE